MHKHILLPTDGSDLSLKKCDVIVMASHGRGGMGTLILGSETNKVLAHSKTPVLACR